MCDAILDLLKPMIDAEILEGFQEGIQERALQPLASLVKRDFFL